MPEAMPEIRSYTTSQKMDVFKAFFLANTVALFKKHGFEGDRILGSAGPTPV